MNNRNVAESAIVHRRLGDLAIDAMKVDGKLTLAVRGPKKDRLRLAAALLSAGWEVEYYPSELYAESDASESRAA